MPADYVEDYTVEERLGTGRRQQTLQNKKVPQDFGTLSGPNGESFNNDIILLCRVKSSRLLLSPDTLQKCNMDIKPLGGFLGFITIYDVITTLNLDE